MPYGTHPNFAPFSHKTSYIPDVRRNSKKFINNIWTKKKIVNALIIYWKDQLEKQGKNQLSDKENELLQDMFLERFKIWARFDSDLWKEYFPDEQYSKHLFGIVDNFMVYWQHQKNKYEKK